MARRALGAHWRRRTATEQEEFVQLFTDLLERHYADIIESYTDEKIVYVSERTDGAFAEVNSKIFTAKGQELSINYKAHLVGQEWKVYDVIAEDISLVNNYRSQFNRVISSSSYEELVRRLKEKQARRDPCQELVADPAVFRPQLLKAHAARQLIAPAARAPLSPNHPIQYALDWVVFRSSSIKI